MRGGPDFLNLIGDRVDLIHAPSPEEGDSHLSGRDYDCIVQGLDLRWPLRLRDPLVLQQFHYDAPSWFWVCRGSNGPPLAIDALEDQRGTGHYSFPTRLAFGLGGARRPAVVAAYLAAKRVRKGSYSEGEWERIAKLAADEPDVFTELVQKIFGAREGKALADHVSRAAVPSSAALSRAQRAQRWRRLRSPSLAALVLSGGVRRVFERATAPTGLWIEIAGPDGTGKSTLAAGLADASTGIFRRVRRNHWRPGLLGTRSSSTLAGRDHTDPHGQLPRSPLRSFALALYHWADFFTGSFAMIIPHKVRSGLWIQERGWSDAVVDPRRYRLDVSPRVVRALGSLLPKPDLLLVLAGDPRAISERQDEISREELQRQLTAWREMAVSRSTTKLVLDAAKPLDEVRRDAFDAIATYLAGRTVRRLAQGWTALPVRGPHRWLLPRGPRPVAAAAMSVHQPMTRGGRLMWKAARVTARAGVWRMLPRCDLPPDVLDLVAPHLPPHCIPAFARSNHLGRWTVLVMGKDGSVICVMKVATVPKAKRALARERDALKLWGSALTPPVRAPALIDHADGLLVLEGVSAQSRRDVARLGADVAASLGRFQASASDGSVGHGDFAPWNLLLDETGHWVLVDWESASAGLPPYYDLWHWLVQTHALLGGLSLQEVLSAPTDDTSWTGAAFRAYSEAAGLDLEQALPCLRSYLDISRAGVQRGLDPNPEATRAREELQRALNG